MKKVCDVSMVTSVDLVQRHLRESRIVLERPLVQDSESKNKYLPKKKKKFKGTVWESVSVESDCVCVCLSKEDRKMEPESAVPLYTLALVYCTYAPTCTVSWCVHLGKYTFQNRQSIW